MTQPTATTDTAPLLKEMSGIGDNTDAGAWSRIVARFRDPSTPRSLFELGVTLLPFLALWALTTIGIAFGYWISLLLALPAAAFLVRLFMIQHDCSHGSFFRARGVNDWIGRVLGVLTMTPYDYWQRSHAIHHASSGNLARRGTGDISTLTVREYLALPRWGRLRYRLYRHPVVMFGIGPIYLFLLQHRIPAGQMRAGWRPWASTMLTNLAIAAVIAPLIWFVGVKTFLLVHLPITLLAGAAGVWLFYVQHQFEDTVWETPASWKRQDAALLGSSYYDLPPVLRWFTANIGIHHVHHLCSRIPFYRLRQVLRSHPELASMGRLTLRQSLGCVRLALWDEQRRKLVSFREALRR